MKEHVYTPIKKRIRGQFIWAWSFLLIQIATNVYLINDPGKWKWPEAVVTNLFFASFLSIPALIIFYRYYFYSKNKQFIVRYDFIQIRDTKTGSKIEIRNEEITKITLVENYRSSRFPWMFLSYFSIQDAKNNNIIVTCFFMDISTLWLDDLARKISPKKLEKTERMFPIFNRRMEKHHSCI